MTTTVELPFAYPLRHFAALLATGHHGTWQIAAAAPTPELSAIEWANIAIAAHDHGRSMPEIRQLPVLESGQFLALLHADRSFTLAYLSHDLWYLMIPNHLPAKSPYQTGGVMAKPTLAQCAATASGQPRLWLPTAHPLQPARE